MIVQTHPNFDRSYKKHIAPNTKLKKQFSSRLQLFIKDPYHPLLRNHQLSGGLRQYRSFSVTGDIRVIYLPVSPAKVILYDIGSHNQVY